MSTVEALAGRAFAFAKPIIAMAAPVISFDSRAQFISYEAPIQLGRSPRLETVVVTVLLFFPVLKVLLAVRIM